MKRLLLLLGFLAVASPACAWKDANGNLTTSPGALSVPYNQRVAVVWDGACFPGNNSLPRVARDGLGNYFEMLSLEGGAHVDHYSTGYFTNSVYNSQQGDSLWKVLGSTYPVVIFPMLTGWDANNARFFSACSTSAQIIVCGGSLLGWRQQYGARAACDTSNNGLYSFPQGAETYGTHRDTLFNMGYGVRRSILPTGVSQVVRLFHPLVMDTSGGPLQTLAAGKAFGGGADTAYAVMPAARDTVVGPLEYMPVAWRVYWTAGGHVDCIPIGTVTATTGACWADVLWALTSRYVKLNPIRWAYDWDDFLREKSGETRMSKARVDSILVELAAYDVRPTIQIDPGHATAYLNGGTPPGESAITTANAYGQTMKGLKWWSVHSHDSTSAWQGSSLFGRTSATVGAHRYANSEVSTNLGIVQRLAYSDSVRRAVAPTMVVPPYICPPSNMLLPTDWRVRAASNPWHIGDGNCPPESLFYALRVGTGHSDLWVSVPVYASEPMSTWYAGREDTSKIMSSLWGYGDERWRIAGTRVRSVSRVQLDQVAVSTLAIIKINANYFASMLLGFTNPNPRGRAPAYLFGESFAANPGVANRPFTSLNRIRAAYNHPQADQTGMGWNEIACLTRGCLQRMRAMNTLAGHPTWKCVEPWNTGRAETLR